jgi:multidrug efflux pump subunit AcrA (membrane-fusion protein)
VKHDVFVPIDGDVIEVNVSDQKPVKQGELLVRLRNTDLQVQFYDVVGQIQAKTSRLLSVERALHEQKNLSEADRIRLSGEAGELEQELLTLEEERGLLEKKRQMLEVRSPIDGEVMISWDVLKSLPGRPVTTGQMLMSVADPSGDWELELYMRESRSGKIRAARNDTALQEKYPGAGENVTYVLATDPETERSGKIKEIKGGTEVEPEEGTIVRMKVSVDRNDIGNPHPGATVTAKVYCGRRVVGYVWFYEAWEWFQSKVLFRLS